MFHKSLLQNSLGSGIYCREELLSLGARASRPHKTWQGRGDWLHRVGRFTRRLTLEQRLDKYAGGTPALPGGNPWLARCRSLSRALFCRSILPPSHARLRILQKALLYFESLTAADTRWSFLVLAALVHDGAIDFPTVLTTAIRSIDAVQPTSLSCFENNFPLNSP